MLLDFVEISRRNLLVSEADDRDRHAHIHTHTSYRVKIYKFAHTLGAIVISLTGGLFPYDRRRRDALRLAVQRDVAVPLDAHVGRLDDPPGRHCKSERSALHESAASRPRSTYVLLFIGR